MLQFTAESNGSTRASARIFSGVVRFSVLCAISLVVLCGCAGKTLPPAVLATHIQVFGIQMHSAVDYRELSGVVGEEEPCLHGYERSFAALQVSVGYGFDRKIRKIITRNPTNSLFGIRPGMTLAEAAGFAAAAGFSAERHYPNMFRNGAYLLAVTVDREERVAGMSLEFID